MLMEEEENKEEEEEPEPEPAPEPKKPVLDDIIDNETKALIDKMKKQATRTPMKAPPAKKQLMQGYYHKRR